MEWAARGKRSHDADFAWLLSITWSQYENTNARQHRTPAKGVAAETTLNPIRPLPRGVGLDDSQSYPPPTSWCRPGRPSIPSAPHLVVSAGTTLNPIRPPPRGVILALERAARSTAALSPIPPSHVHHPLLARCLDLAVLLPWLPCGRSHGIDAWSGCQFRATRWIHLADGSLRERLR